MNDNNISSWWILGTRTTAMDSELDYIKTLCYEKFYSFLTTKTWNVIGDCVAKIIGTLKFQYSVDYIHVVFKVRVMLSAVVIYVERVVLEETVDDL